MHVKLLYQLFNPKLFLLCNIVIIMMKRSENLFFILR